MLEIAVCDDEKIFCDRLAELAGEYMESRGRAFCMHRFLSAEQLLAHTSGIDILLLDIQMPNMDGMQLAQALRAAGSRLALIFVTSFKEHVFDAFALEAVDYICKPIDESRLANALQRALQKVEAAGEKRIFVKTMNRSMSVKQSDVFYCEVINRKVYLHTKEGVIDFYCKIDDLEKQLDYRFVKCHRSYLVNLDYFEKYENGSVKLHNGALLPVSRLRHQAFTDAMMQYIKRK